MKIYFNDSKGCQAVCEFAILKNENTVLVTELCENKGESVTNCIEIIANLICENHSIDKKKLVLIEHYNSESYCNKVSDYKESFTLVRFKVSASNILYDPCWEPCKANLLERIKPILNLN